jgi:predicted nucleotidyltransferase
MLGLIDPKLGVIIGGMEAPTIANALFSQVQQRVLALLFGNPETSFYEAEIKRRLRSGKGAVERELARLEKSGLVTVERIGNQKHYRANRDAPIFLELYGIVQKTLGLGDPLRHALAPLAERIKLAFVYGSIAKGTDTAKSDVDLMVIGNDLTYSDLYAGLEQAERSLARKVNPTILDWTEWKQKRADGNAFIEKIASQPKIFIVGSQADLSDE